MDPARPDARLADAGLALALALVLAVVAAASPGGAGPGVLAACAALGAPLLLRRRAPAAVLAVTVSGIFAYYIADLPPLGMVLPAAGALFSAAEQGRTRWAVGGAVVLLAVSSFFRLGAPDPQDVISGYGYVTEIALAAAAIALGAALRSARQARERARRIEELTAVQEARAAADRIQAERLRTARDLHDSIGHALAVASLHAGIALDALEDADPAAREAVDQVRASTAQALAELRGTVRVLRGQDALDEVPGLQALPSLVADARRTGLDVTLHRAGIPAALPGAVEAAVHRVVQEALTNVLRHAGARRAEVEVLAEAGTLHVHVQDDGRGAVPARPEGAGLRGMRERLALLGGTLETGPAPGGGFAVHARIPLRSGAPEEGP